MDASSTVTLHTGRRMPVLGLGTWLFDEGPDGIARAIDAGFRMIDTAVDYGSQQDVGPGIERSGAPRDEIYVVTKIEEDDDPMQAADAYVHEMGLEHADLIVIHRPPDDGVGRELWQGLIEARREGLATDIGVSNYASGQIESLIDATGEVPTVNQVEWTPFGHSLELLEFCRERGIVIQAYSPLTRAERLDQPDLVEIADRHGKSPAQVLIRWNLQLGTVPLPKARGSHIEENVDVFDFELSPDELDALTALNRRWSALGSLAYA